MPSWTLGDVVSRATAALGNRSDIGLSTASFWANQAEDIVWNPLPHDAKDALAVSSTTSGEDKITLPTDFQALLNVSNLSAAGRDLLEVYNIDDVDSSSTNIGTPIKFVRFANWLELWPSPDSSYSIQIRYEKRRSDLTETTHPLSVGTRYGQAVFLKTCELLAQEVVDVEKQREFNNRYINYMASIPSDLALRQRTREGMSMKFRWRGKMR
jgi:hypothetical protein